MEQASHFKAVTKITLVALPVEMLVYVISFLSTRERVGIRCVSKRLRSASEIPSLWEEFIWSHYAPRDDKLLEQVLQMFGKNIKIFHFADHIAPSKLEMILKFCKNLIQLSLPSFDYETFEKLEKIVSNITNLQILCMLIKEKIFTTPFIQQIFMLSSNLKELSLHYDMLISSNFIWDYNKHMHCWLVEWVNSNYVPRKLNIIFNGAHPVSCGQYTHLRSILEKLQLFIPMLRNKTICDSDNIGWFSVCVKKSTNFSLVVPQVQLRVTESSVVLPSVKATKYGILGLDNDTLHLTEGIDCGKKVHKALLTGTNNEYIDTSVTSLASVTYFDASYCYKLCPGHLEQLSIACPNLQRLNLRGNTDCLNNLQGLHSIADNCKSLQGLNLNHVEQSSEYSCLELWEVLCTMHLIQLAIDHWMIKVRDKVPVLSLRDCCSIAVKQQKLINMFKNYTSLKDLEIRGTCYVKSYSMRKPLVSENDLLLVPFFHQLHLTGYIMWHFMWFPLIAIMP